MKELESIMSVNSLVNPMNLVVYELNERDGSIEKLDDYKGLPSDENFLNNDLGKTNDLFIKLLEIQDLCQ